MSRAHLSRRASEKRNWIRLDFGIRPLLVHPSAQIISPWYILREWGVLAARRFFGALMCSERRNVDAATEKKRIFSPYIVYGVSVHILPGSIRLHLNFLILSGKDVVRIPRSAWDELFINVREKKLLLFFFCSLAVKFLYVLRKNMLCKGIVLNDVILWFKGCLNKCCNFCQNCNFMYPS